MATKLSSARYGWVLAVRRDDLGRVTDVRWTSRREGAKPFRDDSAELEQVRAHLYDKGIAHEATWEHVPWIDKEGPQ